MEKQSTEEIISPIEHFIAKQKLLLEFEHQAEVLQHKELLSTTSVSDLESMGLCLNKLGISNLKTGLYGKVLLTLTARNYNKKELESNPSFKTWMDEKFSHHKFSPGDTIGLFEVPQDRQPNLTEKPDIEGVVYQLKQHKLIIAVHESPENENFRNNSYTLVLMTNEVTHKRYLHALNDIQKLTNDRTLQSSIHSFYLMNVLFGIETPENINPYSKKVDSSKIEIQDKSLNEQQRVAVEQCLKSESIYMVHGPPGTGKTKTICEFIHQCVLRKMRVLACASSNIAVDNIVERLLARGIKCCRIGHPARLLPTIVESSLDSMVYKDEYAKNLRDTKRNIKTLLTSISKAKNKEEKAELKKQFYESKKELKSLEKSAIITTLQNCQVILATNAGAADKILRQYTESLSGKSFDVLAIDECAQALEVSCWVPLLKAKKAVLAGDHQQLPPTIKSREAEKGGLNVTLFDRLMKNYSEKFSQLLRVQYRMNSQIMNWSSNEVYQGKLIADESVANHTLADLNDNEASNVKLKVKGNEKTIPGDESVSVITLLDTAGCHMGENVEEGVGDRQSKFNLGEADLVLALLQELKLLYGSNLKNEHIGVITPYNAQVELIRKTIAKGDFPGGKIEVSTVDGFQGREKEVIIISMVRSNPRRNVGFLADYRRMNVAVTRAKRYACLICDSDTVKSDAFLKKLIVYFEENGDVRSASEFQGNKDVHFNVGDIGPAKGETAAINKKDDKEKEREKKKKKKNKKKKNDDKSDEISEKKEESKEVTDNSKLDPKKEQEMKYLPRIKAFLNDKTQRVLALPSDLNSFERMQVHEFAEKNNLIHESVGEGADRHIVLKKPAQKIDESQAKQSPEEEENGDAEEQEERKEEEKIEGQSQSQSQNQIQNQNQTQNKNQKKKKKKQKPQIDSNDTKDSGQVQKETENNSMKPVQSKKEENKPEPQKKDKEKKGKKPDDDMDDDAFLDMLIAKNKKCYYQGAVCNNNIEVLGLICQHCGYKFCTRHALPEIHGCGDMAKVDARQKFREEFNINSNANSLKPLKKNDEEMLKKKLAQKIDKVVEGRGVKVEQKKKGK